MGNALWTPTPEAEKLKTETKTETSDTRAARSMRRRRVV